MSENINGAKSRHALNTDVDSLLKTRAKTHGDFDLNSKGSLEGFDVFMVIASSSGAINTMPDRHRYAIMQICSKLARVCSHPDGYKQKEHWEDVAGYARLAEHEDDESMRNSLGFRNDE